MKKILTLAAAAAAVGNALAGEVRDVNHQYTDWQWTPITVSDTNADENVRNQMDFTVPIHGPWLTMPKPDSMTVTWITRIPCAGGIDYREKGTTNWVRRWPVKYGQVDYTKDIQSHNLTGLKPATEYEYRLVSNLDNTRTAYHAVVCEGREIHSFRTVDPNRDHYKVWMTSDIHGSCRLSLERRIVNAGATDCDYYFWLGDNVEDGMYLDSRYWITFGFLDDVVRLYGKRKPSVFMRGNHDIHGHDTTCWGDYFPQPDGKTYQAFRQGPVLWISLDTMWPSRVKVQNEQVNAYLVEQREWMREMKKTDLWKTATFRVVMGHVAPFPAEGAKFVGDVFRDFLCDESKDGRIHAFLSGHHHQYFRFSPNSSDLHLIPSEAQLKNKRWKYPPQYLAKTPMPERFPFVDCFFDCGDSVTCDVSPEKLVFKAHNPRGGLHDAFEIHADGTVKDAAEGIVTYPFPELPQKKPAKAKGK